jgi:hypothetical protein
MGRGGIGLDNLVIQSWHYTLEFELRHLVHLATTALARARFEAWIDEYNRDSKHSAWACAAPSATSKRCAPVSDRTGRRQLDARPARQSMAPSSPASRPRPAGGLRPALTPAAGGADKHRPGPEEERSKDKIRPTEVSTVLGDCQPTNAATC